MLQIAPLAAQTRQQYAEHEEQTHRELVRVPRKRQWQRLRRVVELECSESEPRRALGLDFDAARHEHELEEEEPQRPHCSGRRALKRIVGVRLAAGSPWRDPDRERTDFEQERVPLESHERLPALHKRQVAEPHERERQCGSPTRVAHAE